MKIINKKWEESKRQRKEVIKRIRMNEKKQ